VGVGVGDAVGVAVDVAVGVGVPVPGTDAVPVAVTVGERVAVGDGVDGVEEPPQATVTTAVSSNAAANATPRTIAAGAGPMCRW
jgi:hypothetical protein